MYAKFESDAFFDNCVFKEASFNGAKFEKNLLFQDSKFVKFLTLTGSLIKNITFANTNVKILCLQNSTIEGSVQYEKTGIEKVRNRYTYTILKEKFLQQHDNISALGFHKKEMKQYKSELTLKDNFTDKFILLFKKIVNNYGTNLFFPIL